MYLLTPPQDRHDVRKTAMRVISGSTFSLVYICFAFGDVRVQIDYWRRRIYGADGLRK
jgi:hypothetical protein